MWSDLYVAGSLFVKAEKTLFFNCPLSPKQHPLARVVLDSRLKLCLYNYLDEITSDFKVSTVKVVPGPSL